MDRIQAARVFIEIVERGSMIAAANHLDMSRSMVTRYLSELEDWANARLLHRSTRRLNLTMAGETVLQHCRALLSIADDIPMALGGPATKVSGHLRIACAYYAAEHCLLPILNEFNRRYPDVVIELQVGYNTVDLVEERIDLALRISSELDPNLIAKPLGKCESVLCASAEYIKLHGMPHTLSDLAQHQCLIYSHFGRHGLWRFKQNGEKTSQPVNGHLIANDSDILLKAALLHAGITYQPKADAQPYLNNGKLLEVLPQYQLETLGIYGVYRSRKHMPQALRLLLDML